MTPRSVFHGQITRNIKKLHKEEQGSAFYKSLYNFFISLVTNCKNITIIYLTLLPTYLSDFEILASVEHLKNLKFLSF